MRLLKRIHEQRSMKGVMDFTVLSVINKNCKPFLREMKGGDLFWRGTEKRFADIKIFTPRTDRRPRDTDLEVHQYMDDLFYKVHGWRARSEGVFTTNDRLATKHYGNPYAFFPIGKYKYLWNPGIKDLKAHIPDYIDDIDEERYLIAGYKSTNLKQATVRNSEVMFKCKSYYLVDARGPLLFKLEELLE